MGIRFDNYETIILVATRMIECVDAFRQLTHTDAGMTTSHTSQTFVSDFFLQCVVGVT